MSGFVDRMTPAQQWEQDLMCLLRQRGWLAEPFGQAQIPKPMREYLWRWRGEGKQPTLLRWAPDLLAIQPRHGNRPYVCLIDAKTERPEYRTGPNCTVEAKAVECGLALEQAWGLPIFYVWPDAKVLTPSSVRDLGQWRSGKGAMGSQTDYYLVEKRYALPADALFTTVEGCTA